MPDILIDVYCVKCKKKEKSTLKGITEHKTNKGNVSQMAKGICKKCEGNTCVIISKESAESYKQQLSDDKPVTKKK